MLQPPKVAPGEKFILPRLDHYGRPLGKVKVVLTLAAHTCCSAEGSVEIPEMCEGVCVVADGRTKDDALLWVRQIPELKVVTEGRESIVPPIMHVFAPQAVMLDKNGLATQSAQGSDQVNRLLREIKPK
jgi:hypothetical protein